MTFGIPRREVEQNNIIAGKAEIDCNQLAEGKQQESREEQHGYAEADLCGQHPTERSHAA